MTIRIQNPVGFGGTNDPADVELVQRVLRDRVPEDAGGPQAGFVVTGRCDGTDSDPTVVAIKKFQWRQLRTPAGGANSRPDGCLDPGGFSLRRLSAYDPGPGLVPPTPAGPRGGRRLPLLFTVMWRQIENHRGFTVTYRPEGRATAATINAGSLAPTELWMALFWEESNFRNKAGRPSRRGAIPLGFGQVMNTNLTLLNSAYGTAYSRESVLGSFDESIQVAMLALAEHWRTTQDLQRALMGYANEQDDIVKKWTDCSAALQGLHLGGASHFSDVVSVRIREILWAARDGRRGCTPDLAFA
ncbi:MAG: hypothetical protein L0Z62_35410 [Gemmataceae bacterium]|nr:hypothetical protein [Gemmataceae bacterium]